MDNDVKYDEQISTIFNSLTKTIYLAHKHSGLDPVENFMVATTAVARLVQIYAKTIRETAPVLTDGFETLIVNSLNAGFKK
jgi:hypothetical protein